MNYLHNSLKKELYYFLSKTNRLNKWFVFNRLVGRAYFKRGKKFVGPYKAGEAGQSDLYIMGCGRCIEVELKGTGDKLSHAQKNWQKFCLKNNIPHVIIWQKLCDHKFDALDKILKKYE